MRNTKIIIGIEIVGEGEEGELRKMEEELMKAIERINKKHQD